MSKRAQQIVAFTMGAVFIIVLLILAVAIPNPTVPQWLTFKTVLTLAAAGIAAMIPGFLRVDLPLGIRAGGAIAVFIVVYFFNPAQYVADVTLTADSGWMPGGRDPVSYCNEQQAGLQAQHPALHFETVRRYEFPPEKHKNGLGIVTGVSYRYQCWFRPRSCANLRTASL
jgi:hypothetical protein